MTLAEIKTFRKRGLPTDPLLSFLTNYFNMSKGKENNQIKEAIGEISSGIAKLVKNGLEDLADKIIESKNEEKDEK